MTRDRNIEAYSSSSGSSGGVDCHLESSNGTVKRIRVDGLFCGRFEAGRRLGLDDPLLEVDFVEVWTLPLNSYPPYCGMAVVVGPHYPEVWTLPSWS
eukprot:gene6854-13884_t